MELDTSTLAGRVAARMAELGLSQADIARRGRFNATFVSDLLRGKINLFALDTLVNMLVAVGLHVEVSVREAA